MGWFTSYRTRGSHPSVRPTLEALEGREVPTAGLLDETFGTAGVVSFGFSFTDGLNDIALQSDGKVVAGGVADEGSGGDFALARFNADGSLDTTFGTDGRVRTDFGTESNDVIQGVEVLTDGKILVAGYAYDGSQSKVAIARYNTDGTLDTTFGTDGTGRVTSDYNPDGSEVAFNLTVMSDGRFVVCGGMDPNSELNLSSFFLARYNADGTPDTTFGTGGLATTDFGPTDATAFGVAVLSDGRVVAGGHSSSSGGNFSFAVARYTVDGTPDATFGIDGRTKIEFGSGTSTPSARDLAVQADGKVVLAGVLFNTITSNADIGVARLNADGTLDTTFDADGLVTLDYQGEEDAHGVAVQSDGKIVLAGLQGVPGGSNSIVARLNSDGTPDTGFGTGGATVTDIAQGDNDGFEAVLILPDGKIVAAGTAGGGSIRNFGLARHLASDNATPVAVDDSAVLRTTPSVTLAVLANDTDTDGDALQVVSVTQPAQGGTVAVNSDGTITYTQTAYATGTVSFTYTISDGQGGTATGTVTITLALPPSVGIEMLRSQVVALDLSKKEERELLATLRHASRSLPRHPAEARSELREFLRELAALKRCGRVDAMTYARFETQVRTLLRVI